MKASIVRRERGAGSEHSSDIDGGVDALLDAVSGTDLKDLVIETAHGRTIISGIARYQLDRDKLFEAIKQVDGWESKIVIDVGVERQDIRGFHTVQTGETLASIAERYFQRASGDVAIFEANRDRLNDPEQIFPGQQLLIPWR